MLSAVVHPAPSAPPRTRACSKSAGWCCCWVRNRAARSRASAERARCRRARITHGPRSPCLPLPSTRDGAFAPASCARLPTRDRPPTARLDDAVRPEPCPTCPGRRRGSVGRGLDRPHPRLPLLRPDRLASRSAPTPAMPCSAPATATSSARTAAAPRSPSSRTARYCLNATVRTLASRPRSWRPPPKTRRSPATQPAAPGSSASTP